MPPKPGYRSTEFWLSIAVQGLSLAVLLGFVTLQESRMLEETLSKAAAAVVTLIASAKVVIEYIRSRTKLKTEASSQEPAASGTSSALPPGGALLVLVGLLMLGVQVQAEPILPWRQQINERLRFQEKLLAELMSRKHETPQQPPILVLPIPGEPKQALPIGGEPKQKLPIEGEPKQPLPRDGPPRQELPLAPPGEGPQRLSVMRALHWPRRR